ncbi:hypothetical protein MLD52_01130 [Puniceicoccaceae bacterium K14]|nr:hypothetical protein [Puniceicoccaceae bacterium K14]
MSEEDEIPQLSKVFINMGSSEEQAVVMATQLLKRAEQLANVRGKGRVEALQYLMNLVVSGRSGVTFVEEDGKNIEKTDTNRNYLNDL